MALNKVSAVDLAMHRLRVDDPISNHQISEHSHLEPLVCSHTDMKRSSTEGYYTNSIDDYPAAQCCYCPTSPSAADGSLVGFVAV